MRQFFLLIFVMGLFVYGCHGDDNKASGNEGTEASGETETYTDTDSGTDTDADSYTDTDADSDTATVPGGDILSRWIGTKGNACYLYIDARCKRKAQCSNGNVDEYCITTAYYCPWIFLEDGTAWTTQSLLACAKEWETFDCDDVLLGKRPACALPGSYAAGERCRTSHQCASRACVGYSFPGQYDGTCANAVPSRVACDANNVCIYGDSCVQDVCTSNTLPVLEDDNYPLGDLGAPCMNNADCVDSLFCQWVDNGEEIGVCAHPPSAPEACGLSQSLGNSTGSSSSCDLQTSYCGTDDFCHALPSAGSPCGEAKYYNLFHCDANSFCNTDTKMCISSFQLGDKCAGDTTGEFDFSQARCDVSSDEVCVCAGEPKECPIELRTCLLEKKPGESCTGPYDYCGIKSLCLNNYCDYPDEGIPSFQY